VVRRLVFDGRDLKEIEPSEISLEPNNILSVLLISTTEKNSGVVLVLNKELHGGLYEASNSNTIRFIV